MDRVVLAGDHNALHCRRLAVRQKTVANDREACHTHGVCKCSLEDHARLTVRVKFIWTFSSRRLDCVYHKYRVLVCEPYLVTVFIK
jgi:hypothetical protein